jgi:hypothetical protein
MDLTQKKLSKSEWESIEIPVSDDEKKILKVIMKGYANHDIRFNDNQSLIQILRILSVTENMTKKEIDAKIDMMHSHFFTEYFSKEIKRVVDELQTKTKKKGESQKNISEWTQTITNWLKENTPKSGAKDSKIKKVDLMRIKNMESNIISQKNYIFEYVLLDLSEKFLISLCSGSTDYGFQLYTLTQLKKSTIPYINTFVLSYINHLIDLASQKVNIADIFYKAYDFIEKNPFLLKYQDITLYNHQKQLFHIFNGSSEEKETPKLVLYTAPTGTGKTVSPLGLAMKYRVIFVCVARHVGLALAKSAISIEKKVAFAFGCQTASDIRLHYFSAVEYSVHKKSGGIFKVDNSVGTNVEIMICDVQSYLTAMYYMLAFNDEKNLITYWDEPTITMDYASHQLHETIHRNWKENKISKMVLSCATLPKEDEIQDTIADFRNHFENAEIHCINSYDCRKTISLLNKDGKSMVPHLLFSKYDDIIQCANYCDENRGILRYLDLSEIIRYIEYVNRNELISPQHKIENHFDSIENINMNSIKTYYLTLLKKTKRSNWDIIHEHLKSSQTDKFPDKSAKPDSFRKIHSMETSSIASTGGGNLTRLNSVQMPGPEKLASDPSKGLLITTRDAHTLTDGPTIFIAEDAEKVGKFYIQNSNIPESVFNSIMEKIRENEQIQKKIDVLEKQVQNDSTGKKEKDKKEENEMKTKSDKINRQIDDLRDLIKQVSLDFRYIPNTKQHQTIWIPSGNFVEHAFVPRIDSEIVKEIMMTSVSNQMKLLLLMGIGVFTNNPDSQYMEIMKAMALSQCLYIIIAQSDYIYGTNYQFCHGFIGKDLINLTQQKTIQALGRIGRSNIQQEYTVRFRDDNALINLFKPIEENMEAINMSKLFCSPEGYYEEKRREMMGDFSDEEQ